MVRIHYIVQAVDLGSSPGGGTGIEKLTNFIQFRFETLLLIVNVSILIYV